MSRGSILRLGIVIGFLVSIFLVNWELDRTNFGFIAGFYSIAFFCYLLIIRQIATFQFKHLIAIAGLAHLASMLYEPNLSNDYYRFLWDGEMGWNGINVFDFKPDELTNRAFMQSEYMQEIYTGMSDLSKRNYSCYPPVNQLYFFLSTGFSSSVAINVFMMKLLIVLTEVAGVIYLRKLFTHFSIKSSRIWILFLNPLLIIECTGNVHFEGVMISLLFISFYYLFVKKMVISAIFFGLAVQIKLVPVLLLPFYLRFFGWKKSIIFYLIAGTVILGLGLTLIYPSNVYYFLQSLELYFRSFAFNSFIYYNFIELGKLFVNYNPTGIIGPYFSGAVMITIIFYAFARKPIDWSVFFKRLMFGFFIYLIFGSTLHPWYVLPLLALSLFTNYTFPIVWSFLIFFSYFFYSVGNGGSFEVRLLVSLEYIILFAYLAYELYKKGIPFTSMRIESPTNKKTIDQE